MRSILLLLLLLGVAPIVNAQNIEIRNDKGDLLNGTTITILTNATTGTTDEGFVVKNTTAGTLEVGLRRYETSVLTGTKNFFCWSICYGAIDAGTQPIWEDMGVLNMQSGLDYHNFHVYYQPEGLVGVSTFRYVLFDANNPSDSAYVDVVFDGQITGTSDKKPEAENFSVYPNPAKSFVVVEIPKIKKDTRFVLSNLLGEKVIHISLENTKNKIDLSGLPEGIYIYSILQNSKMTQSKRLVIGSL